ncbi:small ribosomal subunit protein mS79 (rPPR3b)-like [Euphorbia lathyris]|uniref:small ribosomal subunit protein mS79 (rPPR3b)-like n=1 Tax=Euphorbia lathyris TaxID=212925 RepID=UPI0033132DEF
MSSAAARLLSGLFTASAPTKTAASNTVITKSGKFQTMVSKFKTSSESEDFRSRYDIYLNTVLRLAKFRRFSMIEEILQHQKNFKDITDEPYTSRLIALYGKAGMFENARKLYDEMPDLNCPRTVYSFNALLSACIDSGKFDKIEGILKDLPDELRLTLDVVSYNIIIKGYYKMRALDSAAAVLDRMIKEGVNPNLITFNTLLNGFYSNDRFADGERIWGKMEEMNVVPNVRSYNAKLYGLAFEKRMKEAVELIEEMKSKEIEPDLYSYRGLIRAFVEDENLEEAKWWYCDIMKKGCVLDKITLEKLLGFVCEKGDFCSAYEICVENLKKCRFDEALLQVVADGLIKDSKVEDAEKLMQLSKRKIKVISLSSQYDIDNYE